MSFELRGERQLQARMTAIGQTQQILRTFAPLGLRHIKLETPRRTGNLSRNNVILSVTDREVRYGNRANYAVPVHEGSRPHDIRPVRRRALRFAAGGSARLSGTPRSGSSVIFAKRVRHPGNKPNPWMKRGLEAAMRAFGGLRDAVYSLWNKAA